ncbi:hypothetical protein WAI453_013123 [Rhynchosporium graminicola]
MSQSLLARSIAQRTAYKVVINEVKFLPFGENGLTSIGTANLNGCSAVMVLSNFGAILGHIAPLPDNHAGNPAAGDEHAESKMSLLKSLIFERALTDLHLLCSLQTYIVAVTRARSGVSPAKGTIFISGHGNSPRVYIEDVEVTIRNHPSGGESLTTSYGSSLAAPLAYTPQAVPGYGSSSNSYSIVPAVASTPEASSSDEPYYYVRDRVYYYHANGVSTRLADPPKNVWVLNENGWADTNRQKMWRYWDGRTTSFG